MIIDEIFEYIKNTIVIKLTINSLLSPSLVQKITLSTPIEEKNMRINIKGTKIITNAFIKIILSPNITKLDYSRKQSKERIISELHPA